MTKDMIKTTIPESSVHVADLLAPPPPLAVRIDEVLPSRA
jgi:hypothetical protein